MMSISRRQLLAAAGRLAAVGAVCGVPRRLSLAAGRRGSTRDTLRLAFFTDVHTRTEWETPRALAMAAHAINSQRPELVLAGGDLITDGFEYLPAVVDPRWEAYLAFHHALEAPVVAALGNHDLVGARPLDGSQPLADPRAAFRSRLNVPRTYRTFDAAGYRVILLDSVMITDDKLKYHGRVDEAQLGWLRGVLARVSPVTPIVLVTHIPLLTGFYAATEGATFAAPANRVVVNNREVLALLEGHNLLVVLQGHLHVDELLRWRGTTFITGGAVCGKWWRGAWHGTPEGFGMLTLRPDRVDWEYHSYGWKALRP